MSPMAKNGRGEVKLLLQWDLINNNNKSAYNNVIVVVVHNNQQSTLFLGARACWNYFVEACAGDLSSANILQGEPRSAKPIFHKTLQLERPDHL